MVPIEHSNYRHSVIHVDLPFCLSLWDHYLLETHRRNGWIIYQSSTHYCWAILNSPYISGYSCHCGLNSAYHHCGIYYRLWFFSSGLLLQKTARKICKSVGKLQKPPIGGSIMKRCKVWNLNWHSHGIEGCLVACERSQLLGGSTKWTQLDMSMLKVPKYHVSLLYLYVLAVLEPVGQLGSDISVNKNGSWLILANRTFWCLPATAKCSAFQPVTVPTSSKPPKLSGLGLMTPSK